MMKVKGNNTKCFFMKVKFFCHLVIPLTIIPYALTKTIIFPARISGHYAPF